MQEEEIDVKEKKQGSAKKKSDSKNPRKHDLAERKWDDFKDRDPEDLDKGAFTAQELEVLQSSIVEYCHSNRLNQIGTFFLMGRDVRAHYKQFP